MSMLFGVSRVPRTILLAWRTLSQRYGHARSIRLGVPIDAAGDELPWFTYSSIEYISQFDFSGKSIFEWGAGHSSLWWARRAGRTVSIEHDPRWVARLRPRLPDGHELHLVEDLDAYPQMLERIGGAFDVIIIDGVERRACCHAAIARLQHGGLVILDNSDWHHHCAAVLRDAGLLEVDFAGFGPVNGYTWTTSLFFHREFAFPLRSGEQPVHSIGSLPHREAP